jgi:lipopolysaccharide transport system ATP-binding protein
MASITAMCSRCLWLEGGRLVADGSPAAITEAYLKKVRQQEEAEIAATFGGTSDAWQENPATAITAVEVLIGEERSPSFIAETGRPFLVRCQIALDPALSTPDLRIWIERGDGIRVTDNRLSGDDASVRLAGSRLSVDADFGTLYLRPFFYRIHAELWDRGRCIAHRSAAAKVIAERGVSGGEPALRLPLVIVARHLAPV